MALWYYPQKGDKGATKVSFHQKHNNAVAFLCGGGPSLSKIDPKKLNGPNRIVFGLNNTYPFVRPDVWIAMDDPYCHRREIFYEPFIKIARGGHQYRRHETGRVNHLFNMFYADMEKPSEAEDIFKINGHDIKFVWKKATLVAALHIVLWMGCKKIYLFGNDCSMEEGEYHDAKTGRLGKNYDGNRKFYKMMYKYLKWFSATGKKYGIDVYSCSEGGRINDFLEFVDYEEVIRELETKVPHTFKLDHCNQAEARWKKYLAAKRERKKQNKK